MLPYEYARLIVQSEGIKTQEGYQRLRERRDLKSSIPLDPGSCYKQWRSWSDFLGVFHPGEFASQYREKLVKQLKCSGKESYLKRKRGAGFGI